MCNFRASLREQIPTIMPNDINKLRRLMRTAHVLQKGDDDHKFGQSLALKQAWWFESFRDALANGFARFTYAKKDGSTRTALGTRSPLLIPADKAPGASPQRNGESGLRLEGNTKAIPYFDLDKREWRSFSVNPYGQIRNPPQDVSTLLRLPRSGRVYRRLGFILYLRKSTK